VVSIILENKEDDAEQMLKRINIEEPKEEAKKSKIPLCITELIQKLKDNKKIVIGVSICIIFLVILIPIIAAASSGNNTENIEFDCDADFCPAHVTQESDFNFEKIEGGCYKNTIDEFQKTGHTSLDTYTHRYSRGTKSSSEECIDSCKTGKTSTVFMNYHYAALEAGGSCFCGSAEPQEELDLSECPMTCTADDTDYCGGTDNHATIYYVENTIRSDCIYDEEESIDRQYNETIVKEKPPTTNQYHHCWSRFQCPRDYHIEYYFQNFDLYTNRNFILIFNANENIQIQLTGRPGAAEKRPELYKWYPIEANEIEFQRRSNLASHYDKGFKMRLRCAKKED